MRLTLKSVRLRSLAAIILLLLSVASYVSSSPVAFGAESEIKDGYAIVATPAVLEDAEWVKVVDALATKYSDQYEVSKISWDDQAFLKLRDPLPKYVCFVVKPEEASVERLATIWQETRKLDDDPYGDVIWGIITGFDASDAIRLANVKNCEIKTACGGTSIPLDYFESGVVFDESKQNHWRVKEKGGKAEDRNDAPDDTTHAIADALNTAQLFVTSGHASERNWSLGYAYKNGYFISQNGVLFGAPSNGDPFKIQATGSKIHIAAGNCLLANINNKDCMTLALIRNVNVDTLIGYVVPTWFGYMGWGVLDYFIEQPGRFSVAESVFVNNQALLYTLEKTEAEANNEAAKNDRSLAQKLEGLKFDRDVVAIYGDPAWKNALVPQDSGWNQKLESKQEDDGSTTWTLTIEPLKGAESYKLVDGNGSQRSGRPIFQLLPKRIANIQVIDGAEFNPVVTDNFILVPLTSETPNDKPFSVKFSSK